MSKEGHHDNEIGNRFTNPFVGSFVTAGRLEPSLGGRASLLLPVVGVLRSQVAKRPIQVYLRQTHLPLLSLGEFRLLSSLLAALAVSPQLRPLSCAADCAERASKSSRRAEGPGVESHGGTATSVKRILRIGSARKDAS